MMGFLFFVASIMVVACCCKPREAYNMFARMFGCKEIPRMDQIVPHDLVVNSRLGHSQRIVEDLEREQERMRKAAMVRRRRAELLPLKTLEALPVSRRPSLVKRVSIGGGDNDDDTCMVTGGEGNGSDRCCTICLEELRVRDVVPDLQCGHEFHVDCLVNWAGMTEPASCAVCRADLWNEVEEWKEADVCKHQWIDSPARGEDLTNSDDLTRQQSTEMMPAIETVAPGEATPLPSRPADMC